MSWVDHERSCHTFLLANAYSHSFQTTLKSLLFERFANTDAATGHNNDRTCQLFEGQTIKGSLRQLQVATSTFFIQPEKEDTGMATRRIDTQVGKAFIRSDEPPFLLLYPRPECFIC